MAAALEACRSALCASPTLQELSLHTTPLAVSAWRLLPAGALVVAWANSTGRKAPSGAMAWVAIALFGIVDGACFQASFAWNWCIPAARMQA